METDDFYKPDEEYDSLSKDAIIEIHKNIHEDKDHQNSEEEEETNIFKYQDFLFNINNEQYFKTPKDRYDAMFFLIDNFNLILPIQLSWQKFEYFSDVLSFFQLYEQELSFDSKVQFLRSFYQYQKMHSTHLIDVDVILDFLLKYSTNLGFQFFIDHFNDRDEYKICCKLVKKRLFDNFDISSTHMVHLLYLLSKDQDNSVFIIDILYNNSDFIVHEFAKFFKPKHYEIGSLILSVLKKYPLLSIFSILQIDILYEILKQYFGKEEVQVEQYDVVELQNSSTYVFYNKVFGSAFVLYLEASLITTQEVNIDHILDIMSNNLGIEFKEE